MEEIKSKLVLDDSGFVTPIKNVIELIDKTQQGLEAVQNETKDAGKELGKSFEDGAKRVTKSSAEIAESQSKVKQSITDTVRSFGVLGFTVGDVIDKFKGLRDSASNYLTALRGSIRVTDVQGESIQKLSRGSVLLQGGLRGAVLGFNALKVAIAATGIGLIIVALGSLVAFLTTTEKGAIRLANIVGTVQIVFTKLADEAAKLGGRIFDAFDNPKQAISDLWGAIKENFVNRFEGLINLFGSLGRGIKAAFSLDFNDLKKAAGEAGTALIQVTSGLDAAQQQKAKDYFNEVKKGINDAVDATKELNERRAKLEQLTDKLLVQEATNLSLIAKYKKEAEDITLPFATRIESARKLVELQEQELKNKEKIALENFELVKLDKNRANNLAADNRELAEAEANLFRVRAEAIEKSIEGQNKLNGLVKEATDLLLSGSKEITDIAVNLGNISESDAFEILKLEQIEKLRIFRKQLQDVGAVLEKDVSPQLEILDKALITLERRSFFDTAPERIGRTTQSVKNLEDRIQKIIDTPVALRTDEAQKSLGGLLVQLSQINPEAFERLRAAAAETIDFNLQVNVPKEEEVIEDFDGLLDKILEDVFGEIDGPKARKVLEGASEFIGQFASILNEATNIQLANIDKQIDKLAERRETLQDDLEKELELQELGLANNVTNKQAEVDGLLAEEERLNQEREELQRQAQQRQLLLDSALQAQSLITASINIIKGFSNIPFIGLPLGIAAVATLTAFFAKTKAQAFAATRLYKGADRIGDYFGEVGHRTDIPGRGEGYRVIDAVTGEDTRVRISGREMILPEAITKSQKALFDGLKKGIYNFDIAERLNMIESFKGLPVAQPIVVPMVKEKRMKQYVPFVTKSGRSGAKLMEIREGDGGIVWFDM